MAYANVDQVGNGRLRFIFKGLVISRTLAADATLGDIALTLGDLPRRPRGAPLAIDVTLAPRHFAETLTEH